MIIQINVYLQIAVSSERRISVRMCNKGFWARHGSWNRMPQKSHIYRGMTCEEVFKSGGLFKCFHQCFLNQRHISLWLSLHFSIHQLVYCFTSSSTYGHGEDYKTSINTFYSMQSMCYPYLVIIRFLKLFKFNEIQSFSFFTLTTTFKF